MTYTTTTTIFSNSTSLLEHRERFPGGVSYSKEEMMTRWQDLNLAPAQWASVSLG